MIFSRITPSALCLALTSAGLLAIAGCVHKSAREPRNADILSRLEYVDLLAGEKVEVVVPILRSGGYVVPSVRNSEGGTIETGDDFRGYQRDYYRLARRADGAQIRFQYAVVWEAGKTSRRHQPRVDLFRDVANLPRLRLVFLTRLSKADHSMAIVAANDEAAIDALTRAVIDKAQCSDSSIGKCKWVPEGIAVIADKD